MDGGRDQEEIDRVLLDLLAAHIRPDVPRVEWEGLWSWVAVCAVDRGMDDSTAMDLARKRTLEVYGSDQSENDRGTE